ncbi:MAG: DUF2497 domain-containing protein [Pseudomonadota bacterium]
MASAQPEPSMEEILASIRRIISEDDAPDAADSAGDEPPKDFGDESAVEESASFVGEESHFAAPESTEQSGGVFGFLGGGEDQNAFTSEAGGEPDPIVGAAHSASAIDETNDDAPAAQASISDDPTAVEPQETDAMIPADERAVESVPQQAFAAPPSSATASTPDGGTAEAASILADETAHVAGDAFRSLSRSIRISSEGEKSLEDIVTDLLRPLVKEWLDRHLATIVEEKVQDEVERIARRAR